MPLIPKSATKKKGSTGGTPKKKSTTGRGRVRSGDVGRKLKGAASAIRRNGLLELVPGLAPPAYESGVARLEELRALPVEQRLTQMLDEYFVLQHGMSTGNWQALQEVQYKIALREDNTFGESTRAFLALLEAKKVDLSLFKSLGDWRAMMAGQRNGEQDHHDEQLGRDELVELVAGLVGESGESTGERHGEYTGLVMGSTVAGNGTPSRPVAAGASEELQAQLAALCKQAVG